MVYRSQCRRFFRCRSVLSLAIAWRTLLQAHAFTITFPFSADFSPTYVGDDAVNLTAASPTNTTSHLTGTAAGSNRIGVYSGVNCLSLSSSATTAVSGNQYIEFTLTPQPGYTMTLFGISLAAAKDAAASTRGFTLRTSESGYASELWPSGQLLSGTIFSTYTEDFTNGVSVSYSNLNHAVTFRFYVYNSAGQEIFVRNLALTGITAPVPSPIFTFTRLSGSDLILSGSNGLPNTSFYLLAGTNIIQSVTTYSRLSTNTFDDVGKFTITNALIPGSLQKLYRLQVP